MVFVTVGNATQGFRRLLDAVDAAAGAGVFGNDSIIIQSGNNPDFHALHCLQERFLEGGKFQEMITSADVVISHGGAGSLIHALQVGKVPLVMPRRHKYAEHVDDHQVELVEVLASQGRVIPILEPGDLPDGLDELRRRNLPQKITPAPRLLGLVTRAIEELTKVNLSEPR